LEACSIIIKESLFSKVSQAFTWRHIFRCLTELATLCRSGLFRERMDSFQTQSVALGSRMSRHWFPIDPPRHHLLETGTPKVARATLRSRMRSSHCLLQHHLSCTVAEGAIASCHSLHFTIYPWTNACIDPVWRGKEWRKWTTFPITPRLFSEKHKYNRWLTTESMTQRRYAASALHHNLRSFALPPLVGQES